MAKDGISRLRIDAIAEDVESLTSIPTGGDSSQYLRGDKMWVVLNKAAVGLSNVDNTSDANKPISNAAVYAFSLKEPLVTGGTTSQFYRGDKTWVSIDKSTIGLSNVDNTSDANKPVSTLQANALATKEPVIVGGSNTQYWRGDKSWQTLDKSAVGLSNVDNTSDASKPISTATQSALNTKEPTVIAGTITQYWRGDKSWQTLDKTTVGLANVDNTSDANKPVSTAQATALSGKEPVIVAGTVAQYWRGDKSWVTLDKSAVGLANVDNTSDVNKPISTATQTALNAKEPTVTAGTTTQYRRGDKTWQTLDKSAVGLSNVDNTSDVSKPVSTATQTALNAKEPTIVAGVTTQYWRGDKTWVTLDKTAVGLNNVDNTSDANKPISTATQTALNTKEPTITAGVTGQYWRGDKTWQTLDKTAVGLGNVDNTSDTNKPVSSATQTALNNKEATIAAGTTGQYWRGDKTWVALDKTAVGLANVDNTSDVNKPVSTATQTALNAKEATIAAGTTAQYWRGDKSWQTLNATVVGLGNVNNTSDANKPVSTAQQSALDLKANLASPAFTGSPTVSANPTVNMGIATKQYVDMLTTGLQTKTAAVLATTGNITLSGEQTIDDTLTSTTRTLVKDQTNKAENGIYVSASGAWTRATDLDSWDEFRAAYVFVSGGKVNKSSGWNISGWSSSGTLGTTDVVWNQFSASPSYTGSNGVTLNGQEFSLTPAVTMTIKGNTTSGTAIPTDLSVSQVRTMLAINNVDNTSDANKPVSTAQQSALNAKEPTITAGTTGQYWRGDKSWQTLDKSAVGLSNVDNVSDANKPISTATQTALNAKEPTITAGTTTQYRRGDKTWQTLDKTAVGLANVDNTSDVNKPVSTAQQTALNAKEPTIAAGTTGQYWRGDKTWVTLDKTAVGLSNVDNTSDVNKPISTAQQSALDLKAPLASPAFTGTPTVSSTPVGNTGIANKQYVDALTGGLQTKTVVAVATTGNITLSGEQTIDTFTTSTSRVLVKDQTTKSENGIYVSGSGTWTRTTDLDSWDEFRAAYVFVNGGKVNKNSSWTISGWTNSGVVGTTDVVWSQCSAPSIYTGSGGITLAVQDFSLTPVPTMTLKGNNTANTAVPADLTVTQTKVMLALNNVDNTSDVNKPISTAQQTALNAKEPTITAGTTGQYWRGDKTWVTLDKTAVGLANVDNTSDANKPVSTAQQTALNTKEPTIGAGTTSQYWRGDKTWQTLDKSAVGLGNVDNTSDANKPVSTAQQSALDLKANLASPSFTGTPSAPTAAVGTNSTVLATTAFVKIQGYATLASPAFTGGITVTGNGGFSGSLSASNFSGSVTGTNTGDQTITLTGAVTGSGTGSFATTLAAGIVGFNNLATASVLGSKLAIGDKSNMVPDPMIIDPGSYKLYSGTSTLSIYNGNDDNGNSFVYWSTNILKVSQSGIAGTIPIVVAQNTPYMFRALIWSKSGDTSYNIKLIVQWFSDAAGTTVIQTDTISTTNSKSASTKTAILTAPAGTVACMFGLDTTSSNLGGYFTNPSVRRAPDHSMIVDGPGSLLDADTLDGLESTYFTNLIGTKEPTITAGTTAQYWRGDKTWQTLDKTAVGLGNVDNTSDANKPVSSATQSALNLKAPINNPTFTGTVNLPAANGTSLTLTTALSIASGGTGSTSASDARTALAITAANTPFSATGNVTSTNTQSAIAELDTKKAPLAAPSFTGGITVTGNSSFANNLAVTGTGSFTGNISANNFSGTFSGTSSGTNTGDQTITLTGAVTGTGTGSFVTTLAAGIVLNGNIGASAVTGSKVLLGDTSNMVADPLVADIACYQSYTGTGGFSFTNNLDSNNVDIRTYTKNILRVANGRVSGITPVPVVALKAYYFSVVSFASSSSGDNFIRVFWFSDLAGTNVVQTDTIRDAFTSKAKSTTQAQLIAPTGAVAAAIVYDANNGSSQGGYMSNFVMRRAVDTLMITDLSVTLAKIQSITTGTFLGRTSATDGSPEIVTAAQARTMLSLGSAALANTGTSGTAVPLLNTANTWSATQTFGTLTAGATSLSSLSLTTALPIASGGTGAATAGDARTALAITATNTPSTATGNIVATNVQSALAELDTKKAPIAGPTFTGTATFADATFSNTPKVPNINITAAAGTSREIQFSTANSLRWKIIVNNASESGSNAGSNFTINRYDDTGAIIDAPLLINRSNGAVVVTTPFLGSSTGTFTGALSASNFSGTSSGTNTGDQTITLTGAVTGSGTGSFATTYSTKSLTGSKLYIGDSSNMLPDPLIVDKDAWRNYTLNNTSGYSFNSKTTDNNGNTLTKFSQNSLYVNAGYTVGTTPIPIDAGAVYYFRCDSWGISGNFTVVVQWFSDLDGTTLISTDTVRSSTQSKTSTTSIKRFVPPAGAVSLSLGLNTDSGGAGAYINNIYIGRAIINTMLYDNAVTIDKIQTIPTATFLGRATASDGNPEVLTVTQTKTVLSLNNVDNTSDANKPVSTAQQTALNAKEPVITAGTTTQYWRGDKSWQTLDKTAVGLANVDNTSDANKPVSSATQTALNAKEPTITAGTTGQYWRGDKTWQTLDKSAVGLANVDNTSDVNKPISTATQTALNNKLDSSSYTANDVLNKIITVDGTGSGLDADLLDGYHASSFCRKYSQTIGDGSTKAIAVTHNLGTRDVQVSVYKNSGNYDDVIVDVTRSSTNAVVLTFGTAPASNAYRVVIIG